MPFLKENIAEVLGRIFMAVKYLHDNGIAHLDIKPENVLVGRDSIKLGDFGSSLRSTQAQGRYGTAGYQAPVVEFARFRTSDGYLTQLADLWSLGMLCHVVIFGCPKLSIRSNIYYIPIKGRSDYRMRVFLAMATKEDYAIIYDDPNNKFAELINSLIVFDPAERLSADHCLALSVFLPQQ